MVTDDDVDAESLQAQIDMSMSFARNLVTSWIKPSHLAQLRFSSVDVTLEDELRRPPRLGVGASVPATPQLAHEASKLKHRLGKNKAKTEHAVESQPQDSSKADDEERKGRPAKRKVKVDPFGHEGSKKRKRADSDANPHTSVESDARLLVPPPVGELIIHDPFRTERERIGPDERRPPAFSKPSRETSVPVPRKSIVLETSGSSSVDDCIPVPDNAEPHGIPLLNPGCPPKVTDQPGDGGGLNNNRKKRKRRKKKKKVQTIDRTGDNSH